MVLVFVIENDVFINKKYCYIIEKKINMLCWFVLRKIVFLVLSIVFGLWFWVIFEILIVFFICWLVNNIYVLFLKYYLYLLLICIF